MKKDNRLTRFILVLVVLFIAYGYQSFGQGIAPSATHAGAGRPTTRLIKTFKGTSEFTLSDYRAAIRAEHTITKAEKSLFDIRRDNYRGYIFSVNSLNRLQQINSTDTWLFHKAVDADGIDFFILTVIKQDGTPTNFRGLPCPSICGIDNGQIDKSIVHCECKTDLTRITVTQSDFEKMQIADGIIYTIKVKPEIVNQVLNDMTDEADDDNYDNAAFFHIFVPTTAANNTPTFISYFDVDYYGNVITSGSEKLPLQNICTHYGKTYCQLNRL